MSPDDERQKPAVAEDKAFIRSTIAAGSYLGLAMFAYLMIFPQFLEFGTNLIVGLLGGGLAAIAGLVIAPFAAALIGLPAQNLLISLGLDNVATRPVAGFVIGTVIFWIFAIAANNHAISGFILPSVFGGIAGTVFAVVWSAEIKRGASSHD